MRRGGSPGLLGGRTFQMAMFTTAAVACSTTAASALSMARENAGELASSPAQASNRTRYIEPPLFCLQYSTEPTHGEGVSRAGRSSHGPDDPVRDRPARDRV